MNFQRIPPVPRGKGIIERAFSKARKQGIQKNLTGNWLQIIRRKESLKLDVVKESLVQPLLGAQRSFPDLDKLPEFYLKLIRLTIDYNALKISLGSVNWAVKSISNLHREYVSKVNGAKTKEAVKSVSRESYGRLSSVIKRIDKHLHFLEECRQIMRTYPDFKEGLFTVCIYGFPNVGKTTLLNKLAGTTAEVAPYPFTTKTINSGTIDLGNSKIQIFDVPGTLDRKDRINIIEKQAELVASNLADLIIYVFDASEYGGYSIKQQKKLLQNISDKRPLVYLSKTDLVEETPKLKQKTYSLEELKTEIIKRMKKKQEEKIS